MIWIDLAPALVYGKLTYDHRWTTNAAEYVEYLQARVRRWRQQYTSRNARRVGLLSHNDWVLVASQDEGVSDVRV